MNKRIKVFHLEDYKIMRDGIKFLLSTDPDIEYVGGVRDPEELLTVLQTIPVDVLVLDIYLDSMEDVKVMDGFQVCQYVAEHFPTIKVVAHSAYDDADRVAKILKAGAKGFVSKKSGFDELIKGIKAVNAGQTFICSETSKKLKNLNKFLSGIEGTLRGSGDIFSSREREIMSLLATGQSSRQVAEKLFITERTVETHRKNMLEKASAKNTVELIAFAGGLGLLKK